MVCRRSSRSWPSCLSGDAAQLCSAFERGTAPLVFTERGRLILGGETLSDAICRPGGDRLSRVLRRSIMGAEVFHGRVRNGIGWGHLAIATRSANRIINAGSWFFSLKRSVRRHRSRDEHWRMRTIKPIELLVPVSSTSYLASTSGLSTWWSSTALIGNTRFQVGFPLRCFQRLSRPYIATLHCGWRHNRSTRGTSIPVLSY